MAFQQASSLRNRTFVGLIVAQFLAGFNDQAIHASAMFFAIHQGILTEAQAISLMPILFYAPWAIFCTPAGYFADRFSKTYSLMFWKIAEIAISLAALSGFYLGAVHHNPLGAWLVLSTVFFMGTHAAFFAPAKYGAMPEILQPHILSRGNGILESTTFLAAILGTVAGGLLSFLFRDREIWIGLVLLVLAAIGAAASFLIAYLPPGCPTRRFPVNLVRPLLDNLKVLLRSKPLALSVLGIAFFIFMVSYMRATMYMHGESRNPRWTEFRTSLVVATVALGVGLGSPLAGFLSGGKIELGLVPLGCIGMISAILFAAFAIDHTTALVVALIIMGFFSGFYMVPLYTLLQHRAPKASKGELVATSNFINVIGAMAASLLFFVLVQAGKATGITPLIDEHDREAVGVLVEAPKRDRHGHVTEVTIETRDGIWKTFRARSVTPPGISDMEDERELMEELGQELTVITFPDDLFEIFGSSIKKGDRVIVSSYRLRDVDHYNLRAADQPLSPRYDYEGLPKFLFFGAALMTLGILLLLLRKLPDFFVRSVFWMRTLRRFRLKAIGMHLVPSSGPVVLATNCACLESSLQLLAVTDRTTTIVLADPAGNGDTSFLQSLAQRTSLILLGSVGAAAGEARIRAAFAQGHMVALGIEGEITPDVVRLFEELRGQAPWFPVFCGPIDEASRPRVRVVFGRAVAAASVDELRRQIRELGEWIKKNDATAGILDH